MMVKICGITNREDALAATEAGATALGFNFYPGSPRFLQTADAARLIETLPAGVWKTGVFVDESPETVARIVSETGLDIVQLHGGTEAPAGVRAWRALRVGADFQVSDLERYGEEAFLLDTPSETSRGGTGKTFDWRLARGATRKVIVAGGLDEGNVREAIRAARPWGVDSCSRIESAPGRKDHGKMRRFVLAALEEGQQWS